MKSDLEIANGVPCRPIPQIAAPLGLSETDYAPYGRNKAKLEPCVYERLAGQPDGRLVLVTAITPTPAGEGKTTTTIGLADALRRRGKKVVAAIREPSLGPVFGRKGGAAGGGWSQVIPMEDINLHFTGDFHAVCAANNLLVAMTDNHIFHGNALQIDPDRVVLKRCLDMNDRALRHIELRTKGKGGYTRQAGFEITAASELMAVLCLATDIADLKRRIANVIVAYNVHGEPVTAGDLHAAEAAAVLLKEAIKPNLVQTLEGTPVLIHGGPFANIAHGCNSLLATRLALKLADYTVTEAGFGADLGAEKFIDIKCRLGGLKPAAAVLVVTVRALKMHGGLAKNELEHEDLAALERGLPNLLRHLDNLVNVFRLPAVVAVNKFPADTQAELDLVMKACAPMGVRTVLSDVWAKGGEGGLELADAIMELCDKNSNSEFAFAYPLEGMSLREKLDTIVRRIYRGRGAVFTEEAERQLELLAKYGGNSMPVCVAKTPYSFTGDQSLIGAPEGFDLLIHNLKISGGAGFVVALAGDIMTMPGLPSSPAAERIHIADDGTVDGLF
ncbi:MAG: formate--tetrahydrofolate ligase [Lentisphaeria bacterium]|nr:formate--tetrahydrofolate ligase [Lentisphaeria bacterium]